MRIKLAVARFVDKVLMVLFLSKFRLSKKTLMITPVFHVEKLYNDEFYNQLLSFSKKFYELTGSRAVMTCITPCSPLLASEIAESGMGVEEYWNRMMMLSEYSIIGLHGHYINPKGYQKIYPMHASFRDDEVIKKQIHEEVGELKRRGLISEGGNIYSGGWWFTSEALREFLSSLGFVWDYSISSSRFNKITGGAGISYSHVSPCLASTYDGRKLYSPLAVSGISQKGRPFSCVSKVILQMRRRKEKEVLISLYSHDYDLDKQSALQMVARLYNQGVKFVEPEKMAEKYEG